MAVFAGTTNALPSTKGNCCCGAAGVSVETVGGCAPTPQPVASPARTSKIRKNRFLVIRTPAVWGALPLEVKARQVPKMWLYFLRFIGVYFLKCVLFTTGRVAVSWAVRAISAF